MTDVKLMALLVAQTKALRMDILLGRAIAHQVVTEIGMVPEDVFPEDFCEVGRMIDDYVEWAYDEEHPRPPWVKDEW